MTDEQEVLALACEQFGTSPVGARPLRRHSNVVYLLPVDDVVVRIKREASERAVRAVAVTRGWPRSGSR